MRNSVEIVAMRKLASSKIFKFHAKGIEKQRRANPFKSEKLVSSALLPSTARWVDLNEINKLIKGYYARFWHEYRKQTPYGFLVSEIEDVRIETQKYGGILYSFIYFKERHFDLVNAYEMGFTIQILNLDERSAKEIIRLGLKYKSLDDYKRIEKP